MVKRNRIVAFLLIILIVGSTMGATTKNILKQYEAGIGSSGWI